MPDSDKPTRYIVLRGFGIHQPGRIMQFGDGQLQSQADADRLVRLGVIAPLGGGEYLPDEFVETHRTPQELGLT